MKKLFTFLLLFFTVFAFGQNTFKSNITTLHDGDFYKTIQLNNGNFVCVGYTDDSAYKSTILISQFNEQGTSNNSKVISINGNSSGTAVVKTADGGFAITGSVDDQMALLKFNANLSLQWAKKIVISNAYGYGYGLIQTNDKGFMIVGKLYKNASSSGYLIKLDSIGNVLFSKKYFGFANNYIKDIAATTDGNYSLIAGTEDEGYNSDSIYLLKIKPNGNIVWSRYINDSSLIEYPYSVAAASDGGIVIAGSAEKVYTQQGFPQRLAHMLMAKFNTNGKMLWSKTIETSKPNEGYALAVMEDEDRDYIFSGEVYTYKSNDNVDSNYIVMTKLSSSGALQWIKTFDAYKGSDYSSEPLNIIRTADGGYAVCGSGYYPNGRNVSAPFLYKFNATFGTCDGRNVSLGKLGNIGKGVIKTVPVNDIVATAKSVSVKTAVIGTPAYICSAAAKLQQPPASTILQSKTVNIQSGSVVISPNPVRNNINLLVQSTTSSKATIQITDVTGKIISTQQTFIAAGANNITIPAASFSKGMYILKVVQNDKVQSVKFIKE